jgi:hypothetical protein
MGYLFVGLGYTGDKHEELPFLSNAHLCQSMNCSFIPEQEKGISCKLNSHQNEQLV